MTTPNKAWRILILVTLLLSAVSVAWAQGETIELDGVSATIPAGWLASTDPDNGAIDIGNGPEALAALDGGGDELSGGQLGVTIGVPSALSQLGVASDASPTVALEALLRMTGGEAAIEKDSTFSVPAARVLLATDDLPNGEALVYALAFPDGTVVAVLQKGEEAADYLTPDMLDLLNSIAYTPSAEAPVVTEEPPVDTEEPIAVEGASYAFGGLSIPIAEGWVTNEANEFQLDIASSEAAMEAMQNDSFPPKGAFTISLVTPAGIEDLGLTAETTTALASQLVEVADLTAQGEIESLDGAVFPTVSVMVSGSGVPSGQLILVEYPEGLVLLAIQYGDNPETHAAAILSIINGLTFGQGSTEPVEVGEELRQWASVASGSSQYGTSSWSFEQATGEPNTDSCGDITTAWASATATGKDQLVLAYDEAVIPTQVNIYQTYNPGAIILVELSSSLSGASFDLPNSADPVGNTPCPGVFSVDVSGITEPVDTVTLYLNQTLTGGWNEIDAVELVGTAAE